MAQTETLAALPGGDSGKGVLPRIEMDSDLMEEVVCRLLRNNFAHPFWQARNDIFERYDQAQRERHFFELSRKTYRAQRLEAPLLLALAEQPKIGESVHLCRVLPAVTSRQEGAELFVDADTAGVTRTLVIRLLADTFCDSGRLQYLLRRELAHIHDMLDPAFEYDPALPQAEGGPLHVDLILRRYRVLWNTVVQGRLFRRRHAADADRESCRQEFISTFGMLSNPERDFTSWFEEAHPCHPDLLAFARDPGRRSVLTGEGGTAVGICPLCHCPGVIQRDTPVSPDQAFLLETIQSDFPGWTWNAGLCAQCLDLYRGRFSPDLYGTVH